MSIIHDALKKVQQGQSSTPTTPVTPDKPASGYIYANSPGLPKEDQEGPIEYVASKPNKARSMLAFLFALAVTLGAFVFLYKQVSTYCPGFRGWAKTSFNKLIHKKDLPDFKTKAPEDLKPLAKITVNPPKPLPSTPVKAATPASLGSIPVAANSAKTPSPLTLNIHGVMANGPSNLVLINDQVYQEGDEIDGIKIVKIDLNTITINNNGKEETIRVKD